MGGLPALRRGSLQGGHGVRKALAHDSTTCVRGPAGQPGPVRMLVAIDAPFRIIDPHPAESLDCEGGSDRGRPIVGRRRSRSVEGRIGIGRTADERDLPRQLPARAQVLAQDSKLLPGRDHRGQAELRHGTGPSFRFEVHAGLHRVGEIGGHLRGPGQPAVQVIGGVQEEAIVRQLHVGLHPENLGQ